MGRKKLENPLVKTTVRLSPETKKNIQNVADQYGLKFSEVMRLSVENTLENVIENRTDMKEKISSLSDEKAAELIRSIMNLSGEISQQRRDINAVGRNMNQIAKALNSDKYSYQKISQNDLLRMDQLNFRMQGTTDRMRKVLEPIFGKAG